MCEGDFERTLQDEGLGACQVLIGGGNSEALGGRLFPCARKICTRGGEEIRDGKAKVASTPFEHGSEMGLAEAGNSAGMGSPTGMADIQYRGVVGSLMYLAVCTRPDLSMAVSALSRYCQAPQPEHWEAAKRVLRYVKGTAGEGLGYSPGEDLAV